MLRLLIRLYESAPTSDWVSICQCLMFLDDAPEVAKILHNLLKGSEVSPGWCPDAPLICIVYWFELVSLGRVMP